MKIETIFALERLNTGNYCHLEMSASAKLEEGDDEVACMVTLKGLINTALLAKACITQEIKAKVENVAEVRNTPAEVDKFVTELTAIPVKSKRNATKKGKSEEITVIPVSDKESNIPEAPIAAPVGKNVVIYNRDLDTHRQLLSSFLNKNHPSWKTTEGVKDFSMGLVGKPFLNNDGAVVESFAKLLSDFFNA